MKTRTVALTATLPLLFLATDCGLGSADSSQDSQVETATGGSVSREAPANAPGSDSGRDTAGSGTPGRSGKQVAAPMSRSVISTGQITLQSKDLGGVRADVLRLVTSWQGTVADEQTSSDHKGRLAKSTLTLRVPSERFDAAMAALAGLGTVQQQSRSAEDVTTQVIDNAARVRAAERSIRQIERLLDRASKLSDIISIESDLARRQADLDSLKSQQAWLSDQTSLSTITLHLSRPTDEPRHEDARGFLTGLDNGWTALTTGTVVLLTMLGALLPFAVLAGVLGVPLWVVVRRRRLAVSA